MKIITHPICIIASFILLSNFAPQLSTAHAQGTAFTYQGRLNSGGLPASGSYDLKFTLCDVLTGGTAVAGPITNAAVAVSNGLFMVALDFGSGGFTGEDRWLEIAVGTNGSGVFVTLSPRQQLRPTPYAIYSPSAGTAASAAAVTGPVSAGQLTGTISSNNIGTGTITSTMLAAGSVTTAQLADGAVTAAKLYTETNWSPILTLANPTPADSDNFATSVAAVENAFLLVGAPGDDTGATAAGAAYLFDARGSLMATINNPAPEVGEWFGYSVGAGNNVVLIGAPRENIGATAAGAAYLFSTNGTLLTTFTNPAPADYEQFGRSVAVLGSDRVLVGALQDAGNIGAAYLFTTNGTLLTTFTNPTPASGDNFGYSITAVGSDYVLVGSPLDDAGANNAGAAYLFTTNGTLVMTFTNPTPVQDEQFGYALAAVGSDRVLIAAPWERGGAGAFLFNTNGTVLTIFTNPPSAAGGRFGYSVAALGNNRVVIGAIWANNGTSYPGAAYVFNTDGALLATLANPTPAQLDVFGCALAAVGTNQVLIGAFLKDLGAVDAGAAYLFSTEHYTPALVADGSRASSINTFSLADDAVTSSKIANGAVGSSKIASGAVGASQLSSVVLSNTFWVLSGNSGTTPGTQFVGTTDHQPLELRVQGRRAFRLEPATNATRDFGFSPNVIGGYEGNSIADGVVGATIAGGGREGYIHQITAPHGTIGGGDHNTVNGEDSTIAGGGGNVVDGSYAAVGGGLFNNIQTNALYATIGGGYYNTIQWGVEAGTIAGGEGNSVETNANSSAIGGGHSNQVGPDAWYATIGGGNGNFAGGYCGTVGGGYANSTAGSFVGVVGGGYYNTAANDYTAVGGGAGNFAGGYSATVGGGYYNTAATDYTTVGGGLVNNASDNAATVSGGYDNNATGNSAAIGGGSHNNASGSSATVGGGYINTANGASATVGGGNNNWATNDSATVPGGHNNIAGGQFSFAAGQRARAFHNGTFVWADSIDADFFSTGSNQFLIRAGGGVGIGTNNPQSALHVAGTVTAAGFAGNGAALSGLNASQLSFGAVPADRLTGTYNNTLVLSSAANVLAGDGSSLTGLNANNLATGIVPGGRLAGTYGNTITLSNAANVFAGDGYGLTELNADNLATGTVPDIRLAGKVARTNQVWLLNGNASTTPGTQFLGTTDNQPVEFKVNGQRALRLEPNATSPNMVAGYSGNYVAPGVYGASIGGGGQTGFTNSVSGTFSTVSGGYGNAIQQNALSSTVGGGDANTIQTNASYSTIGGGEFNTIQTNASGATIGGGHGHAIQGLYGTIPGGNNNTATNYAFAAGLRAKAYHTGAFVWGDSSNADITSTNADSVTMRASGGYRLFSNAGTTAGVYLAPGGGSWTSISDRNAKENFRPVNLRVVLEKVAALPMTTWNYKSQDANIRHIGPMAQDFKAAFEVGETDTGIATIDAEGVALAAIQGLNQKLEATRAENAALKQQVAELKQMILQLAQNRRND
ncbi:MAG TPA: tail fiber domain-containing protein [Candidatus Acidoferrum sp.]|nr:tail fiber domain-containing protein [Candidatus Acidoferrum sp.]